MSSTSPRQIDLDVLVIGGGVAGLWTLDTLLAGGHHAGLVECSALGEGQTICAQGILHGGVKYSLNGLLDPGSRKIAGMPARWLESIDGPERPRLQDISVRTRACHLWRTDSMKSIISMAGAKLALQVRPTKIGREQRPAVLARCPGDVALLPELVVETPTLLAALASRHSDRILAGRVTAGDAVTEPGPGFLLHVEIDGAAPVHIRADRVVVTAGAGAGELLERLLPDEESRRPPMQRRPLHMAMVRGAPDHLPELNGHCVDGAATRVTITSSTASDGDRVWQLGGELAESGCARDPGDQIRAAMDCLTEVLPGFDAGDVRLRWATYHVDRAEAAQHPEGRGRRLKRPEDATVTRTGALVVAWPTKMVLAPRCAELVADELGRGSGVGEPPFAELPTPRVATPPWETATWS